MRYLTIVSMIFCVAAVMVSSAFADNFSLGVSVGNDGSLRRFDLSIGDYYSVPEREVVVIRERGIDEEELPVVFYVARHAHVAPRVIVNMRRKGYSWMEITHRYRLSPEIYYVAIPHGSHHGSAYGHFKHDRKKWKKAKLSDHDVINLVNLKYMNERYHYPPDRIIRMRSDGKRFAHIRESIERERHGKNGGKEKYSEHKGRYKHKGKGKKND